MRKIIFTLLAFLLFSSFASAAIYVKYDGVDGESKDSNHEKWIDVLSIDWGTKGPTTSDPGVSLVEMHTTVGKATPKLFLACADGSHFSEGALEVCEGKGRNQYCYFKATFEEITILEQNLHFESRSDITTNTAKEKHVPQEQVTFNFERVKMTYIDQDGNEISSGPVSFGKPGVSTD
jgi:type VI secretion system secreted protein Hcp